MARPIKWSADKYAAALKGDDLPGLRSIAAGFSAQDGYDLRSIDEWTPYQRRKVREEYAKVRALEAQPRRIVHLRNTDHIKRAEQAFHGDIKIKRLKVAFVPVIEPPPLPGAKPVPVKLKFKAGSITVRTGTYNSELAEFNPLALIEDARAEVYRAVDALPPSRSYLLQVGEYQTLNFKGPSMLADQVIKWMAKYDGKTALTGDKRNENPKHHAWWNWLVGVKVYALPKGARQGTVEQQLSRAIIAHRKLKGEHDAKMRRKDYKKGRGKAR